MFAKARPNCKRNERPNNGMDAPESGPNLPIPKGLRPSAQGCLPSEVLLTKEGQATLVLGQPKFTTHSEISAKRMFFWISLFPVGKSMAGAVFLRSVECSRSSILAFCFTFIGRIFAYTGLASMILANRL